MTPPIQVDLPHQLGAAEARRRIAAGIGKLESFLPGAADVESSWSGDRLNLLIRTLGQEVRAQVEVFEAFVRVELILPPALAFFARAIERAVRKGGSELLEDRSGSRKA